MMTWKRRRKKSYYPSNNKPRKRTIKLNKYNNNNLHPPQHPPNSSSKATLLIIITATRKSTHAPPFPTSSTYVWKAGVRLVNVAFPKKAFSSRWQPVILAASATHASSTLSSRLEPARSTKTWLKISFFTLFLAQLLLTV